LIEMLDMPLIATSANVSGQPTCRSGFEVLGTMDGRVDLLLDAGPVNGLGATTVDITEPEWRVIREGAISEAVIAENLQI
jgi:L-threonylcarbamoyladenylate synthase